MEPDLRKEMLEERRSRLEHDIWLARRDTRLSAVKAACALSEQERSALGGIVQSAKAIESYLRDG